MSMTLSPEATKVFDHLPTDGTKVGGITLQRELHLTKAEYDRARSELKAEYLVVTGRGRGGSLGRLDTEEESVKKPEPKVEEPEPKEPKVTTPAERMAYAREAKVANSRERQTTMALKEKVLRFMHDEGHTQVGLDHISFTGMDYEKPIIEVWNDKRAQIYTIQPLRWDMLRAEKTYP